jgi:probable O-glycosylation ligase (exosortase A-associated)
VGKLLLGIIIVGAGGFAIARPWVGIVSYYLLAIFGPQYIWWWNFEGLRVSLIVAICTIAGFVLKLLKKDYDFDFLKTRLNQWLLVLWVSIDISYFFGPYVSQFNSNGLGPSQLFSMTNNIFIFYFIAALVAYDPKSLRYLGFVFVYATLYLIYWANDQYLSQNWSQFNMGRLTGPRDVFGSSIYGDENAFSMLFVTGIPFVYYFALEMRNRWLRYLLLLIIPLGWHAVFLTGSRGGLLGLSAVTVFIAFLSGKKYFIVPLVLVSLLIAFQLQGGSTMKNRSERISSFEGEKSAEDRLTAWRGGLSMVVAHPFTGVGLGSFVTALPSYIESRHMVAHNTFVQFSAESGVAAGLAYLMVVFIFFKNSRSIYSIINGTPVTDKTQLLSMLNKASSVSFAGLVTCSLFLSLNTYEIFFYLLIFNNSLMTICTKSDFGLAFE